jgi:hypothetical protein
MLKVPALDVESATTSAAGSPLHSPVLNGLAASAARRTPVAGSRVVQKRNIDRVQFGPYDIRTWYFSPYQFDEEEWASLAAAARDSKSSTDANVAEGGRSLGSHALAGSSSSSKPVGGALSSGAEHPAALHANGHQLAVAAHEEPTAKSIWVCEGCFKYIRTYSGFRAHKRDCTHTHPPGRKVYQRGAHTIWEVDGAQQKLYAQNLSLFGKLFIDHKTIYFDVEPFCFYVLTDATSSFDHVIGYFSKEKISYDDYNLACIITFPPYQKSGFGTLMIEFSYYLSSLTDVLGTPERPLSDLGMKGYLSFWTAVALRTLALFFNDQDPDIHSRLLPNIFTSQKGRHHAQTAATNAAIQIERQKAECRRIRAVLLGRSPKKVQTDPLRLSPKRAEDISTRPSRGWAGEMPKRKSTGNSSTDTSMDISSDDLRPDDEPLLDPRLDVENLSTTLERLAEATSLRIDDLCLALSECGLLLRDKTEYQAENDNGATLRLVVTQDRVRQAIKDLRIKRPLMDVQYVLI